MVKFPFVCFLASIFFVYGSLREEVSEIAAPQLTRAIRSIVRSTETHDIMLLIDDVEPTDSARLLSNAVIDSVSRFRPTQVLHVTKSIGYEERTIGLVPGTSRTLVIHMYIEQNIENDTYSKIGSIAHLVIRDTDPKKLLIVTIANDGKINYRNFLDTLWTQRILHATILEVMFWESVKEMRLFVHQLNPFSNVYTKELYVAGEINAFPDKLKNMYGYPIHLSPGYSDPYIYVYKSSNVSVVQGTRAMYLDSLKMAMNATLEVLDGIYQDYTNAYQSYSLVVLKPDMIRDIFPILIIPFTFDHQTYSIPIMELKMCWCVTPTLTRTTIKPWSIVSSMIIAVLITYAIRFVLKLLKIDQRLLDPFNCIRLLLNMGTSVVPRTIFGRVLLLCLLIGAGQYSVMFGTELFNLGTINEELFEIYNFEDLEKAGLTLVVAEGLYTSMILPHDMFPGVRRSIIPIGEEQYIDMMRRPYLYKNHAALAAEKPCDYFSLLAFKRYGTLSLRTSEFCPVAHPLAFRLRLGSPYKGRMDETFLRVHEAALPFRYDLTVSLRKGNFTVTGVYDKLRKKYASPEFRIGTILFCGYVISFVTFLAELLVKCIRMPPRECNEKIELKEL